MDKEGNVLEGAKQITPVKWREDVKLYTALVDFVSEGYITQYAMDPEKPKNGWFEVKTIPYK